MAYTNIPDNLYDYFSTINQRIRKLESAPDQAMDYAQSASNQAINATLQAAIANTNATNAQASANGKNTIYYGAVGSDIYHGTAPDNSVYEITYTPVTDTFPTTITSGHSNTAGDTWFVLNSARSVIAQYTGSGGTSWSRVKVAAQVIANLDAGNITTGTITSIEFNNGSGTFHVYNDGTLQATNAFIQGTIAGSSIIGNTLSAQNGGTGVTINSLQGSIDFSVQGTQYAHMLPLSVQGVNYGFLLHAGAHADPTGTTNPQIYLNNQQISIIGSTGTGYNSYISIPDRSTNPLNEIVIWCDHGVYIEGGSTGNGIVIESYLIQINSNTSQSLQVNSNATFEAYIYNPGSATTTSSANVYMNSSTGLIARVTSSERYKVEINAETIPAQSVMAMVPKSYVDKAEYEANNNSSVGLQRHLGLIAEDLAALPVLKDLLVNYNEQGQPDSVNYDRIAISLIPLVQDLNNRVTKLEGTNAN